MGNSQSSGRRARRVLLIAACGLAVGGPVGCWSLRARPGRGGNPPPGYSSVALIKLAIVSGQLSLVDIDLPIPATIEVTRGIEYGRAGNVSLKLDLYTSQGRARPSPGLLLIHGGGWKSGKREDYRYYGVKFAEEGYAVASISYRLRDVAPFPAAVEDAKCAVRWMRENGEKYGVDPGRIAVIGGSAGGHLSMMVAYSSDVLGLEGQGGHAGVSSRVQAVVNLYGPVDLTTPYARNHDLTTAFIGKPYAEAEAVYERASPLSYVTQDDPPTLIFHGTLDDLVPITQADRLAAALQEAGIFHRYERLEGWPHGLDLAQVVNDYGFSRMLEFLQVHLAP